MKVLVLSAACLLVGTAAHATGDTRTIDAEDVPVADLTRVTERVGPVAPVHCHPANGPRGEPRRYRVRFDIEPDGTPSSVRAADRIGAVDECAGAAERAVRQWTFAPPTYQGEPVRVENAVTTIGYEPRHRWSGSFD